MRDRYLKNKEISFIKLFEGTNSINQKSIVFVFDEDPKISIKTRYLNSKTEKHDKEYRLFINLVHDNIQASEIFEILKNDLINVVNKEKEKTQAYKALGQRLSHWHLIFQRNNKKIDEEFIRGYIGELYFIKKYLSVKFDINKAIEGWVGYQMANQDFHLNNNIIEVKTISNNSTSIKISNKNQLTYDMMIALLKTNKSSQSNEKAYNLSKIIRELDNDIISPETKNIFHTKILELGFYPIEDLEIYDDYVYEFEKEIIFYDVINDFPIINHKDVKEAIIRYKYDISLPMILSYINKEWSIYNE